MNDTVKVMTPLGLVLITATNNAISGLKFLDEAPEAVTAASTPLLKTAQQQLLAYFAGERQSFDLPLRETGTDFQKQVWAKLRQIPYGETWTYGEVAQKIGHLTAARAVGMANHHNPIAIVTPCHRVIGTSGKLTGYAGGLERKDALLKLEKAHAQR